ncbi:hemolysin-III family protein [Viridothelium virens]|uniref:Hemolysin-III family protein n=1 Tax=Viridothelium virens TaxID=1048519 RepID=A0A6A6HM90_VIRVR|nr:hemolysin-III family protein [Viridothelium virens]
MASRLATVTMEESYEEPAMGSASGISVEERENTRRRRHSSYNPRQWTAESDNIQVLVDRFLAELNRRLDFMESYGHLNFDAGVERAYSTLCAVRDSCSHISDGVIDAGRRRAKILVEVLEDHYKGALARRDTMEQKVHEGVRFMEGMLADFEARAYAVRDGSLGVAASDFLDESKRRVDESIGRAKGVVDEGIEKARRAKENLKLAVDAAIQRARERGLLQYHEIPDPWKVNPHILRGYRFNQHKIDCIRSMLSVSNELVNIWSHLIGLIIVLAIAFYFYPTSANFSSSTTSDIFIAATFFFAACKCLVCSTVWHTMSSIAEQNLMERFACVDYTGISFLVAASIMTTEYTAFYCEPFWRWAWMVTTALFGIGGSILPWHPFFNRADMSWARVAFYVTLAATGFFPFAQLVFTRGTEWAIYFYLPIVKSLLVYLGGAVLYAGKVPERWFPGAFDYVGGSHNIWHFAVLGGILFHYHAMHHFFAHAFQRATTEACSVY